MSTISTQTISRPNLERDPILYGSRKKTLVDMRERAETFRKSQSPTQGETNLFVMSIGSSLDFINKELARQDNTYDAILVVNSLFRVSTKLKWEQKSKVLGWARSLIVANISNLGGMIDEKKLKGEEAVKAVETALLATTSAGYTNFLEDAEKLVNFGLKHAHVLQPNQDPQTVVGNFISESFTLVDKSEYGLGGFGAMLTRSRNKNISSVGRGIFKRAANIQRMQDNENADIFYTKILREYGLDSAAVKASWWKTTSDIDIKPDIRRMSHDEALFFHFKAFQELAFVDRKIPAFLSKEFAIHDFGRYPTEILLDQYRNRYDKGPYVLAVFARYDHNHALTYVDEPSVLESLYRQLSADELGYKLRIIEVDRGKGAENAFKKLDEMYHLKGGRKIAGALIFGHGTNESLMLDKAMTGDNPIENYLTPENMQAIASKDYFEFPDPPIVLISCETGLPDGIAQDYSKSGPNFWAPNKETNLNGIKVEKFNNGRLRFEPEYWKGTTAEIFIGGVRIDSKRRAKPPYKY